MPLDAFDVIAATLHPGTRVVDLGEGRAVVRTPGRPDDPTGNAVHVAGPVTGADDLGRLLADARRRFPDPATTARVLARRGPTDPDGVATQSASRRDLDVLVLPDADRVVAGWPRRPDVAVAVPGDDRGWHAVTVLHRHGADDDPTARAARARGGRDGWLRWWVAGRRRLCAEGRARVVVARRFDTPVATLTLVWAPGVDVGEEAAGLAVLTDLVVHPAHRGLGVPAAVGADLLATHLRDFPRARVATVAPAVLRPALERRGWELHDRLVDVADVRTP